MLVKVISEKFAGGYNSVYEQAWDDNIEQFIEYFNDEYDIKIPEDEITNRKYQEYLTDCAWAWLEQCTSEKVELHSVEIIRPSEYNFETDKVQFGMPLTELNFLRELVKNSSHLLERFNKICDERFKEHSGYVPFYKVPDLDANCYVWNKFQLGALFDAYFYDAMKEYQEDCQDYNNARDILENNSYYDCINKQYLDL